MPLGSFTAVFFTARRKLNRRSGELNGSQPVLLLSVAAYSFWKVLDFLCEWSMLAIDFEHDH